MENPIFVVGTQRSGTTLLTRLLSMHPEIFIQNEVPVIRVFGGELEKEQMVKNIRREIESEHGKSLDEIMQKDGKKYWGLKDPQLTEYFEKLEKFIPGSKFIVIIRDGRAVTRSYIENAWGLGTNVYTGCERWEREVQSQLAFVDRYPESCKVLQYEELLRNTKQMLADVCEFLGVEFDARMLQYQESDVRYHRTRENANTFGDIDVQRLAAWKSQLSARQIGIINARCRTTLEQLGYDIEEPPVEIGALERRYYQLHQAVWGEVQIQYRLRKSRLQNYFRKKGR